MTEDQPTERGKILSSYTFDRGLTSRLYKEFKCIFDIYIKTINNPNKKWDIELYRELSEEI